ncbi:MAG: NADH-quinone oxidoreductase subunit G [Gammaproteobacteria bacterium]|nr:NADH-quinone oxidoreductase subunit G [Gammaproteobacteria bacterium]
MKAPPAADTITIDVDGRKISARKGQMLIEVTDAAGIYIPRFCYHGKLSVAANCRMCLVDVEKAPKPLPACATPVMDGMVVHTRSGKARDAQKGTMEFLLINHPLDCPVCDQGGECELQDLAVGYGKDASRYAEVKRIVKDKDIGPLIATEMTRCIHCTRCVRFGEEIAGVMEFGGLGRGEHMEIRTFLDRSVDSELSGNVIDLCPVGALTSKPFRYTARTWELQDHASVSPHDCVGANITVQTRRGRVMRVLPRANEAVNECWLADRDRFSYEALNSEDRLRVPMIRRGSKWEETDWTTALEFTAAGLRKVLESHGPEGLGALAAPISTSEEFYLLQKFMRALGSGNVDHRLRQMDFSDDAVAPPFPALGRPIAELESLDAALLIGANPRKDQPLINLRMRKAALMGAKISAINPLDYDFNYKLTAKTVCAPVHMPRSLAGVAVALAALKKSTLPPAFTSRFGNLKPGVSEQATAQALFQSERASVLLGTFALSHPQAAALRSLAQFIAGLSGAKFGQLPEANAAGAWFAGCVPHRGVAGKTATTGRHALDMLRKPLKACLLLGVEPEFDCLDGAAASAVRTAEFVVMMTTFKPSPYRTRAVEYADVWLPLAPFTETDGTFVNVEGRHQPFVATVAPLGESRPGWKILRMLGHLMGLPGFEQNSIDEVRQEMNMPASPTASSSAFSLPPEDPATGAANGQLMRIAEVPMYAVDAIVRRAPSLQNTADNPPPSARLNVAQADKLGFEQGQTVQVVMAQGVAQLDLVLDERVPDGCVLIPAGYAETCMLSAHGPAILKGVS